MSRKNKNIILAILLLLFLYSLVSLLLIYHKYQRTVRESIQATAAYSKSKAVEISDYLNTSLKTANTISNLFASANEQYDTDMLPYISQALKNLVSENPEFSSFTVTWELSAVDSKWFKPFGRYQMKSFMQDGLPHLVCDTLDIEGEIGSESYYQMKSGSVNNLFTNLYVSTSDMAISAEPTYSLSIATKIEVAGVFVGSVAVEIPLSKIEAIINRQSLEFDGTIFILSNNGKIAIHPNTSFVNTYFRDAYPDIDQTGGFMRQLSDGTLRNVDYTYINQNLSIFDFSTSNHCHICFYPIEIPHNTTPWALGYEINYAQFRNIALSGVYTFILLTFVGLLILVVFAYYFIVMSSKPMRKVDAVLRKLQIGDFENITKLESNDEDTQQLFNSVNFLADRIIRTTKFARSIGQGHLDASFESYGDTDVLDSALIDMQKNLLKAKQEEQNRKEENEKLSWSQNGLAQIGEFLRMNNADISDFAFKIISFLVKYLGTQQGAMFVTEERDNKKILEQKATYAFDRKKQLTTAVEFGESLVGRCAIERKTIYMTDVPEGYLYITSGLGEKKPLSLLLVPLQFEDSVHGVLEIASLNEISDYQIQFLNNVAERIASTISNIKKNINTAELLNKFSTQSDELARREKEITDSYTNIKKAQDDVRLSEREIVSILDVLSQTSIIMRYDTTGIVLDLRDKTLETTGYKQSDIVGHNIRDIFAQTKNEMVSFDVFWTEILNGKTKVRFFKRGNVRFRETFTLLYDNQHQPYKIISVAVPENSMSLEGDELLGQENNTIDSKTIEDNDTNEVMVDGQKMQKF